MSSTTSWKTWEIKTYKTTLDSGHHVLTLLMSSGWANIDWIEFREAAANTAVSSAFDKKISIYPNPSSGLFNSTEVLQNIRIFSTSGQLLLQKQSGNKLDLSSFSAGSYLLISDELKTILIVE